MSKISKMPGFHADASLRKANQRYTMVTRSRAVSGSQPIVPQMLDMLCYARCRELLGGYHVDCSEMCNHFELPK